ncbi:hypothetical protein MXB_5694, partial [Myxobolus squamalis]
NYDKNHPYSEQPDNNYEDYTDFGLDIKVRHSFFSFKCLPGYNHWNNSFDYSSLLGLCVYSFCSTEVPIKRYSTLYFCLHLTASIYGLVLGFATISYKADGILYAAGITLVYLYQPNLGTRFDFTGWGPYLFVFLFGLMIFGIFAMIFRSQALMLMYSYIGAILFSFYMIYDVQIIMGGKKEQIHESEYVLATLNLYLDIINLFLFILNIVGGSRD